MSDKFEITVKNWAERTKEDLLDVFRYSVAKVAEEAQTPKAKGGKMPVDTGFLRKSGIAEINEIPKGETRGRSRRSTDDPNSPLPEYATDDSAVSGPINTVLAKIKMGDIFYFGWTARYARYQEASNGFLISAMQNFQKYVDEAVKAIRNER